MREKMDLGYVKIGLIIIIFFNLFMYDRRKQDG